MKSPSGTTPPSLRSAFRLLGLVGLTMMAGILTGLWAGFKLDGWLNAGGVATVCGILLGAVAGGAATGLILYRSIPWKR